MPSPGLCAFLYRHLTWIGATNSRGKVSPSSCSYATSWPHFVLISFFHPFFLPPSTENLGTEPSATLSEIDARLQALQAYISTLGTHM